MNNGRTGWGWAMVHNRSLSALIVAAVLLLAGCSGTGPAKHPATRSGGAPVPHATGTTAPPAAFGTSVEVTFGGFKYRLSAGRLQEVRSVHFDEPSIGDVPAPLDQKLVTVQVQAVNVTTDTPEPIGNVKLWAFAAPPDDEAALATTWKGSGLECPAEYGLPADACSIPARVASIDPRLPIGEDLMPPGSTETLLVALVIPVVKSVPLADLRLFASDRTAAVEIPVLRS